MKAFYLLQTLSSKELDQFHEWPELKRSQSGQDILRFLRKKLKKEQPPERQEIVEKAFGETFSKETDGKLRTKLSRFTRMLEDFIIQQQFVQESSNSHALRRFYLLKSLCDRKLGQQAEQEFISLQKYCIEQQEYLIGHLATEYYLAYFRQQSNYRVPFMAEVSDKLAQQEVFLNSFVTKAYRQMEFMKANLLYASAPPEERKGSYGYVPEQSINLHASEQNTPLARFTRKMTEQMLVNEPEEKARLLDEMTLLIKELPAEALATREAKQQLRFRQIEYWRDIKQYEKAVAIGDALLEEMYQLGQNLPMGMHSISAFCLAIGSYHQVLNVMDRYMSKVGDPLARQVLELDRSMAYQGLNKPQAARECLAKVDSSEDILALSLRSQISQCLYLEGELEQALRESQNLNRALLKRMKKEEVGQMYSLHLRHRFFRACQQAAAEKKELIHSLIAEAEKTLEKPELILPEQVFVYWLLQQMHRQLSS